MPFRSKAQARFLFSQHPDIAKRWVKEVGAKIVPSVKARKKGMK